MQSAKLSIAEKLFRILGTQLDVRLSSRSFNDFRPISIALDHNKSEVHVGDTQVTVGVNFDPNGTPLSTNPKEGYFKFKIDWSPYLVNGVSNHKVDEYNEYLKSFIDEAYNNSDIINLSDLCITPNKKCWIINIDVLILENDGNLLDVISIAIFSALKTTIIPKITLTNETKELQFDMSKCPIYVTVDKMDTKYLIDADKEEEVCSPIRTMSAILPNGDIKATSSCGEGSVKVSCLLEMLKISSLIGLEMHKAINEYYNTLLAVFANDFDNVSCE